MTDPVNTSAQEEVARQMAVARKVMVERREGLAVLAGQVPSADFAEQMRVAPDIMRADREILRKLAD